jgi:hypothetical protein
VNCEDMPHWTSLNVNVVVLRLYWTKGSVNVRYERTMIGTRRWIVKIYGTCDNYRDNEGYHVLLPFWTFTNYNDWEVNALFNISNKSFVFNPLI